MTEHGCVHNCDAGWITLAGGLMPCPRHKRTTHERWTAGEYEPTGGRSTPISAHHNPQTTAEGLAATRAALAPPNHRP